MIGGLDKQSQEPRRRHVQAPGTNPGDQSEGAPASDKRLEQRIAEAIQPVLPRVQEQAVQALHAQLQESFLPGTTPSEQKPADNGNGTGTVGTIVRPLVSTIPEVLREQGEQPLRSLVLDALDTIFSDSVRARFQHDAESTLRELVDITLEVIPDTESRDDLRMHLQRTLDELLQETLDQIISGPLRADIEGHAERAIDALVAGDSAEAVRQSKLVVLTLVHDFSAVLQEHWHQVLRLLLRVVTAALQEVVTSAIKKGLESVVAEPAEELAEQADSVQDRLQEKGEELRDELKRAVEALRERIEEGTEELQERIQESVRSSVTGQGRPRGGFGHPPSGRPPSGRPPSGRPPSGRAPRGPRAIAPPSR